MSTNDLKKDIIACKNYLLAKASSHEKAACYARHMRDKNKEVAEHAEQQTLLRWASTLTMVLESPDTFA